MNRWMTVTCAAAVAVSGCTTSQVDPDAAIMLSGKVIKEDGQPLPNTMLTINRSGNSICGFSIFGGLNWKSVKTGADGTFTQELLGEDTRSGDVARCFELQVPGSGGGSSMHAQFLVQAEQVQIPTIQQWTGTPAASASSDGVSVTFKDVPGSTEGYFLHVENPSGAIWVTTETRSPVLVNDDLLEDATSLKAYPSSQQGIKGSNTTFSIYHRGGSVALPQRSRVPASRGASCTYPEAPTSCPLTDGELGSAVSFTQGTREVVIQLAQPKVLRKAVLRNFEVSATPSELVLEGSSDGTSWVPLANLLNGPNLVDRFFEVSLSHPSALSQVRLRAATSASDSSLQLRQLSELSLFE